MKRILLVDDDEDDQFIFTDALKELKVDVSCVIANNGVEALNSLKTESILPDLIFLDLNMPMMNGFEFLASIKKVETYSRIPVIIFSTSDNPIDKKRSNDLGAEKFITKTADFKLLKSNLTDILYD